jgi:hypothetical protein
MASRILLCMLCVALIVKSESVAAQTEPQSNYVAFVKKQQSLAAYTHDFIDFSKSDEYEPSSDLWQAANESGEYANAAGSLLEIYDSLSCPADRAVARAVIARDFAFYSKQLKNLITVVNAGIAYTKKPGVAAEAIRMRDEIRELEGLFDSTKLAP